MGHSRSRVVAPPRRLRTMPTTPKSRVETYESPAPSDGKSARGLQTILTAGFSLLKSFGKAAAPESKRKRPLAADSPGDPDTDSASKRARQKGSGTKQAPNNAGGNASFITSSVRKTKGKTPGGGGGDKNKAADSGDAAKNLQSRFASVDEEETRGGDKLQGGKKKDKNTAARDGVKSKSIFSPVFSFFRGGPTVSSEANDKITSAARSQPKGKQPARPAARPKPKPTTQTTRTRPEPSRPSAPPPRARGRSSVPKTERASSRVPPATTGGEEENESSSDDDDVPVARLVSPARRGSGAGAAASARPAPVPIAAAESLESDEAEETESDDAVLAASSKLERSVNTKVNSLSKTHPVAVQKTSHKNSTNPNLAPDGTVIQNGFGKADLTLDDEYEYYDEMDEESYDEEYDPWIFIGGLPPLKTCVPKNRPKLLPPQTAVHLKKNTLVLDLDETLVHSDLEQTTGASCDFSFPVHFNNQKHIVNVRRRPYLREFMEFAARHFEVVVFTASQRVYAERLLDTLDPDNVLIKHRLYREACVLVDGNYMKDLSVIGRDLKNTVIVDNSPQAFGFQCDNGVPIESWFDDDNDRQLLKLIPLLGKLASAADVRPVLAAKFNLHERIRVAEERAAAGARR